MNAIRYCIFLSLIAAAAVPAASAEDPPSEQHFPRFSEVVSEEQWGFPSHHVNKREAQSGDTQPDPRPMEFGNSEATMTDLVITHFITGSSFEIQFSFPLNESFPYVTGAGLEGRYKLEMLRFYRGFHEQDQTLWLQWVYKKIKEGINFGMAVVLVPYSVKSKREVGKWKWLSEELNGPLAAIKYRGNGSVIKSLRIADLLPSSGSLMCPTPVSFTVDGFFNCTHRVSWMVLEEPVAISPEQLGFFRALKFYRSGIAQRILMRPVYVPHDSRREFQPVRERVREFSFSCRVNEALDRAVGSRIEDVYVAEIRKTLFGNGYSAEGIRHSDGNNNCIPDRNATCKYDSLTGLLGRLLKKRYCDDCVAQGECDTQCERTSSPLVEDRTRRHVERSVGTGGQGDPPKKKKVSSSTIEIRPIKKRVSCIWLKKIY